MKKILSLVLTAVTLTTLMGCSAKKENTEEAKSVAEQKVEKKERVIAGTVAIAEILNKLNVEMVGVPTTEYPLPKELNELKKIGNPMKPDLEVIKSLNPTKIVSVDSLAAELKKSFEDNKIEAKFINLNTFDSLKSGLTDLGAIFNKEKETKELLAELVKKETAAMEKAKGKKAPKIMIMFGAPGSFMIATETSFVGDLAKKLGAENIVKAGKAPFIPVNMEMLAKEQPDFILRMSHAKPDVAKQMFDKEFSENKAWQNFKAVKENKVVDLENGYFGMTANLKSVDALEKLADILYK